MRRIDCDGDAKISYEDFRDFFTPKGVLGAPLKRLNEPYTPDHRSERFETEARLGANIERLLQSASGRRTMLGRTV